MDIKIPENEGTNPFGVYWISGNTSIKCEWFDNHHDAIWQYLHLKNLQVDATLLVKLLPFYDNRIECKICGQKKELFELVSIQRVDKPGEKEIVCAECWQIEGHE